MMSDYPYPSADATVSGRDLPRMTLLTLAPEMTENGANAALAPTSGVIGLSGVIGWEHPLLVRIHAGDWKALLELYEEFGWMVYNRAHRITGERLAAELITVGVFTRLWRCPHEFPAENLQRSLKLLADRRATEWVYD